MKLVVFDHNAAHRAALAGDIARITMDLRPQVESYDSYEIFQSRFQGADVVFLSIEGMNDLEAGRKLARFYPGVPLVVVSGSGEYSVEAFALGARDYLAFPLEAAALLEALARCGVPPR